MRRTAIIRSYTVGMMAVLAFVAHSEFTTPMPTRTPDKQDILFSQVPTAKPGPPPVATGVEEGKALAYIRIPRFGKQWVWTVVEGTSLEDLASGPGHFPSSPLPGAEGNVAIAAHRAGHGDPFIDFDTLEIGDEVTISQNGAAWTYRVTTEPEIVEPHEDWVLDVWAPGRTLTLTTCWPKYGSAKRMYVRAVLQASE